jgi:hypothetical protein
MAGIPNKQPIFTAIPILKCIEFDPALATKLHNTNTFSPIYTDASDNGSLITKITVNSPVIATENGSQQVTTKRIYLLISDSEKGGAFDIFDSKLMVGNDGTTVQTDTPRVVFEFPQGLITTPGTILGISSTTNEDESGRQGDRVTVIVEGGTYDQPA